MTITNGYTTLADVKTFLRATSTDSADDAVIERMVENVSRFIDGETHRRFWVNSNDETRTYTAKEDDYVRTDDIVSITSVKTDEDYDRVYEITWAATDYDTLPDNSTALGVPITRLQRVPFGNYYFPTHAKGIQIVGKFGYSSTVPADIKMTTEEIVVSVYKKRFGENTTGTATVTGAGVVITPKDVPDTAWRTINHYRRI